jgi:hypothetical protein
VKNTKKKKVKCEESEEEESEEWVKQEWENVGANTEIHSTRLIQILITFIKIILTCIPKKSSH